MAPASSSAAAGSSGSAPSSSAARVPVVVDTDLDADDLRALTYVAARPEVDLLAVTVAGTGIVHCPAGVAVARAVLGRLGRPDVPVACGRSTPLTGSAAFPEAWRVRADAAHGLDLAADSPKPSSTPTMAVDLLADVIGRSVDPVRLLVIGPATNVAEALAAHPDIASRIGAVTMMGGALGVPGNVAGSGVADSNRSAEWNVFADPGAWQAVLDAGLRPTIVPLDATNAVPVTRAAFLSIAANRDGAPAKLVFDLLEADPSLLMTEQSFWDSLAAVVAFDPGVVTTRSATIRVDQAAGNELGRLVEDPAGAAVTIATTADPAVFQAQFVSGLNGGAPVRPVPEPAIRLAVTFDGRTCRGNAMPATIPTGFVSIELDNTSTVGAAAALFLLRDGVTTADVVDALAANDDKVAAMGRVVASVNADAGARNRDVGIGTRPGSAFVGCVTFDPRPRLVVAAPLTIGP